jgi:hypothetical protein
MPTGRFIGDAVFHHDTHRQGHDTMGVQRFRRRQIGDIGVEVLAALGAMMLRICKEDVAWSARNEVANIMKCARKRVVAVAAFAATWAGTMLEIATLLDDLWFWKILWPPDPFRGIRPVFAGTRHGTALLGMEFQAKKLPKLPGRVMASSR